MANRKEKNESVFQLASKIAPYFSDGTGIFGGLAVASIVGAQREHRDIDILCPRQSGRTLRAKLENALGNRADNTPAGFSLVALEKGEQIDVEVALYENTGGKFNLPFVGQIKPPARLFELGKIGGAIFPRVSREVLIQMKQGSPREKDKKDLKLLMEA